MPLLNPVNSQLLIAINRAAAPRTPLHTRVFAAVRQFDLVVVGILATYIAVLLAAAARRVHLRPEFRNRLIFSVTASTAAFVIVLTAGVTGPAVAAQAVDPLSPQVLSALIALRTDENSISTQLTIADTEIASAQQVLAASSGKTLDETARTKLADQLTVAESNRSLAANRLQSWLNLNALADSPASSEESTLQLLDARQPIQVSIDLTAVEDVNAAVAAWNAEQAAEAAAAAAAAAEAAASPHGHYSVASTSDGDSGDKASIAEGVFARYGFGNYVFNGGQTQGHYAATDMDAQVIYMQLTVIPTSRVASVALHEYQHILQARQYGGYAGAVAYFGSVSAMEHAADCGALAAGATWVNYGC